MSFDKVRTQSRSSESRTPEKKKDTEDLFLLIRILIAAKKATTIFATLLIIGVGLPIIVQAIINMAVAVNLFPVTGQTLPLISSGGTSIWMTCFAIGIILSVTANKEKEVNPDNEENPLDILHEAIG